MQYCGLPDTYSQLITANISEYEVNINFRLTGQGTPKLPNFYLDSTTKKRFVMKWETVTSTIGQSVYTLWNNGRKLVTLFLILLPMRHE